jgi:hypothetical protein
MKLTQGHHRGQPGHYIIDLIKTINYNTNEKRTTVKSQIHIVFETSISVHLKSVQASSYSFSHDNDPMHRDKVIVSLVHYKPQMLGMYGRSQLQVETRRG